MLVSGSWLVNTQKSLTIPEIATDVANSRGTFVFSAFLQSYIDEGQRGLGLAGNAKHLLPYFTAEVVIGSACQVTYGVLRWNGFDLGEIGFVPVASITDLFAPRYIFAKLVTAALLTVSPRYLIALNVVALVIPFFLREQGAKKNSSASEGITLGGIGPSMLSAVFVRRCGNRFSYQQWIIGNCVAAALGYLAGVKLVANLIQE